MSLSGLQSARPATPGADSWRYAEQAFYDHSPFNLWITTLILFAVLFGGYGAAARFDHVPWIVRDEPHA
jgi:hypothetical protein